MSSGSNPALALRGEVHVLRVQPCLEQPRCGALPVAAAKLLAVRIPRAEALEALVRAGVVRDAVLCLAEVVPDTVQQLKCTIQRVTCAHCGRGANEGLKAPLF